MDTKILAVRARLFNSQHRYEPQIADLKIPISGRECRGLEVGVGGVGGGVWGWEGVGARAGSFFGMMA